MTQLLVVVVGLVVGFGGARVLRRPSRASGAASVARSVGAVGSRRDLDLPHLQRSVLSEMMRLVGGRGRSGQVPGAYVVRLHPDDYATVDQAPGFFKQGLEEAMTKAGQDHGWSLPARFAIELTADPTRHAGAPSVDIVAPAGDRPAPAPPARSAPAGSARLDGGARLEGSDGRTHALAAAPTTIGRGADQAIRIDDSRVSRHHATVTVTAGRAVVTDDGSSNGTRLNDELLAPHTPAPLADGDHVSVGPVTFTFRTGPRMTLAIEFVVGLALGLLVEQLWHRLHDVGAGQPGSRRRLVLRVLAVMVVLAVLGTVGGYLYANQEFDKIQKVPVGSVLQGHSHGTNYLIVGTDNRPGVAGDRSDTIMVLRIAHGQSTLMSIPRDLFVTIPGLPGQHRINTAYDDGPATLLGAVQQTLGIPIDRYVEINFVSFAGVVNALGGVVINFPYPASDPRSGLDFTQSGNLTLDGDQALAYVRSRHYAQLVDGHLQVDPTGDLGREKRQQGFLRSVLAKAGGSRDPFKLLKVANTLADGMKVDNRMTLTDAARFAWDMGRLHPQTLVLPTTPYTTSGGAEVLLLQASAAAPVLAQLKT